MPTHIIFLVLLASYLLGSLSFAIVVSYLMGLPDPRKYGSRNPGATNVLRTGQRWAALFTLLGDCLKGWFAVYATQFLSTFYEDGAILIAGSMLGVFLGHIWPLFFRFYGGKGVATAAGIFLAINPVLGLSLIGVWLAVAYFSGYSSLAALISTGFGVFYGILFFSEKAISIAIFTIGIILFLRHRKNIVNLLARKEAKIGST